MIKKEECRTGKSYIIMLFITLGAITALLTIITGTAGFITHAGNTGETMISISDTEMIDTEKETKIIIKTYSGEQYIAIGRIEVIRKGTENTETMLELQGSIEQQNNTKQQGLETRETGSPVVLTVYMDEAIYGFYSSHSIDVYSNEDKKCHRNVWLPGRIF